MVTAALLEAVRPLRTVAPDLDVERLVATLREQRPDLDAGAEQVGEALRALEAEESEATAAAPAAAADEGASRRPLASHKRRSSPRPPCAGPMATLTQGCISQIYRNNTVKQPVVQLIELKMVSSSDSSAPKRVKCARFALGRAAGAASARSAPASAQVQALRR